MTSLNLDTPMGRDRVSRMDQKPITVEMLVTGQIDDLLKLLIRVGRLSPVSQRAFYASFSNAIREMNREQQDVLGTRIYEAVKELCEEKPS